MRRRGIDVSHNNGVVDWQRVKESGVEFAMLRAGFGWDNDQQIDKQLKNNIAGCCSCGLPFGFYHYSYAMSPDNARREAEWFLRVIKGVRPEYPVAFDFEEKSQLALAPNRQLDIIDAWMQAVETAGYYAVLYMSASSAATLYNYAPERMRRYDAWIAHWGVDKPSYPGPCGLWQYDVANAGSVPGIVGRCDVNYAYKDYLAIIKAAGLNGWGAQDTPDVPQEGTDYRDLYESEQAMRIAAEADRDTEKAMRRAAEQERDAALAKLAQVRNIVL